MRWRVQVQGRAVSRLDFRVIFPVEFRVKFRVKFPVIFGVKFRVRAQRCSTRRISGSSKRQQAGVAAPQWRLVRAVIWSVSDCWLMLLVCVIARKKCG